MISKQEILSVAKTLKLFPTTVEKDYILSWILYGISKQANLSQWLFKGGTCLKKCYFETYRFSEDLDFTVPHGSIYSQDEIKTSLKEVADIIYQKIGINLVTREIEVEESTNKKGNKTYLAKVTYLGPLNLPSRSQQRIKFDITDDEIIVDAPDTKEVFHFYSDAPNQPTKITCYSANEILAEKVRAVYERQGRARDIYDIVNISRNFREHIDISKTRSVLKEKFKFKALPRPTVEAILSRVDFSQLAADWKNQLGHQLQVLPPIERFYDDLKAALSWCINKHYVEPILPIISNVAEEKILSRTYFPTEKHWGSKIINANIDQIRYAAHNRLYVKIQYGAFISLVEPYSLRQKGAIDTLLLYGYELMRNKETTNSIKIYDISKITSAEIMPEAFSAKYTIEL